MNSQLNLLDAPAEVEDIWEKVHEYTPPRKYWEDFVKGEICKVTPRWGNQRLCVITKIIDVFAYIKYLDDGKKDFLSLSCLVPASPEDLAEATDADN